MLMSDDVYKSLEQATGTQQANVDIATMISHQLRCQNTMKGGLLTGYRFVCEFAI